MIVGTIILSITVYGCSIEPSSDWTPLFKSSLSSTLEREYLNKKWIGDLSLGTILQKNYYLKFATKGYINKYLPNIYCEYWFVQQNQKSIFVNFRYFLILNLV